MSIYEKRYIEMQGSLKKKNYKVTPQRLAILKILAYNTNHPRIDEIYEILRKTFPTTSPATVYKTIAVLKSLKEVLEIQYSSEGNRYDGVNPVSHPHIYCTNCNKIFDIHGLNTKDLITQLANQTGFTIYQLRMDVSGICPACKSKE
jgi:Fur family peroxide stress response transcriptional regulator